MRLRQKVNEFLGFKIFLYTTLHESIRHHRTNNTLVNHQRPFHTSYNGYKSSQLPIKPSFPVEKEKKKKIKQKKSSQEFIERLSQLILEKQIVVQLALDGASLFISGDAGTGKSFLLRCIIEILEENGLRVAVTASTGIAALGIGGNTFHSTFGVPVLYGDAKEKTFVGSSSYVWYDIEFLSTLDVIIIDEISLLHAGYIEALDLASRKAPGKLQNIPFGGIQIILSGDFMQLMHNSVFNKDTKDRIFCKIVESKDITSKNFTEKQKEENNNNNNIKKDLNSNKKQEIFHQQIISKFNDEKYSLINRRRSLRRYNNCPVFESPVFLHCLLHVRLYQPARQSKDPEFIEDLNKLRRGILTYRLSRSAIINPEDPNAIRLFPTKRAVTAFNVYKMLELNGEEQYFRSELKIKNSSESDITDNNFNNDSQRISTDIFIIHFKNKSLHSIKWRQKAGELLNLLCTKYKINNIVRIMIPPVPSKYCHHLCVYVRFLCQTKNENMKIISILTSIFQENFYGNSKEALLSRRIWGNVVWEVRQSDYLERFIRSSLERRYNKIIQNDPVLQHKRLKIGCRVMLLRNLNTLYVNGSLGTIVGFQLLRYVKHLIPKNLKILLSPKSYLSLRHSEIMLKDNPNNISSQNSLNDNNNNNNEKKEEDEDEGMIVPIVKMDSDNKEVAIPWVSLPLPIEHHEGFCAARVIAMPLTPAYAYTVHKIQGLTFDHPILFDGSGFFPCDHLIYVAASRVRCYSHFRMINVSPRMISVHRGALHFTSTIPSSEKAMDLWNRWKKSKKRSKKILSSNFSFFQATWKLRQSEKKK